MSSSSCHGIPLLLLVASIGWRPAWKTSGIHLVTYQLEAQSFGCSHERLAPGTLRNARQHLLAFVRPQQRTACTPANAGCINIEKLILPVACRWTRQVRTASCKRLRQWMGWPQTSVDDLTCLGVSKNSFAPFLQSLMGFCDLVKRHGQHGKVVFSRTCGHIATGLPVRSQNLATHVCRSRGMLEGSICSLAFHMARSEVQMRSHQCSKVCNINLVTVAKADLVMLKGKLQLVHCRSKVL
mmetsp:Transcript_58758/g.137557  ORF Transcript_58758/g.137557 Transcript_58758/m.137557 type:complete len:240 (-) Transcript_58758:510-1229(-)